MSENDIEDRCQSKACRNESSMIYYSIGLCMPCWVKICDTSEGRRQATRKIAYNKVNNSAKRAMRVSYMDKVRDREINNDR